MTVGSHPNNDPLGVSTKTASRTRRIRRIKPPSARSAADTHAAAAGAPIKKSWEKFSVPNIGLATLPVLWRRVVDWGTRRRGSHDSAPAESGRIVERFLNRRCGLVRLSVLPRRQLFVGGPSEAAKKRLR